MGDAVKLDLAIVGGGRKQSFLDELLRDEDAEKAGRVTETMLGMQKIDIEAFEKAYAGTPDGDVRI